MVAMFDNTYTGVNVTTVPESFLYETWYKFMEIAQNYVYDIECKFLVGCMLSQR